MSDKHRSMPDKYRSMADKERSMPDKYHSMLNDHPPSPAMAGRASVHRKIRLPGFP